MKVPLSYYILPLLVMGCASSPTVSVSYPTNPEIAEKVQVLIITPNDASFEGEVYAGSGTSVASAVAESLRRSGFTVKASNTQADTNQECILGINILHYEDRVTGWSGKPDKITIRFTATRGEASKIMDFSAQSNVRVSAVLEWGNAKPYSLLNDKLDEPLKKLVSLP
jgi:hypothetical protein